MSYVIEITPEAEAEIAKAKSWYEEQQYGLGESFVETIREHINALRTNNPEHKIVFDDLRRVLVKRFTYVVYYKRYEETKTVKVFAILHDKRYRFSETKN